MQPSSLCAVFLALGMVQVAADQCTGGKFPVSPVVVEIHCAACAEKVASVVPKTVCVPCESAAAIDCKEVEVCYDKDKKKFPCAKAGEGASAMAYFTKQIFKNCLCTKEQHLSGADAKAAPVATSTAAPTEEQHKKHKKRKRKAAKAAPLHVGSAVEGNWQNGGDWYAGKITAAGADGTFTVRYNDGDVEKGLAPTLLRSPKNANAKAAPVQATATAAAAAATTTAPPPPTTTTTTAAPATTTAAPTTTTTAAPTTTTTTAAPTTTTTTAAPTTTTTTAAPALKALPAPKSKAFAADEQVVATANEHTWHLARVVQVLGPSAYVVQFGDNTGEPTGGAVHVQGTHMMKLTEASNKLIGTSVFGSVAADGKGVIRSTTPAPTTAKVAVPSSASGTLECPSGMVLSTALIKGDTQECLACPDGTWAAKGSKECAFKASQVCKEGQYYDVGTGKLRRLGMFGFGNKRGKSGAACKDCPHGKFAAAGDNVCAACTKGFITPTAGSTQVSDCRKFSCPAGKYKAMSTVLKRYGCHPCQSGRYGVLVNADGPADAQRAKCVECPKGQTTHKYGQTVCADAPPPTPAPPPPAPSTQPPAADALICPTGKYEATSTFLRRHGCHHCPGGKFGNPLQANGHPLPPHAKPCVTCPKGKWQPFYGKNFCHAKTKTLSKIMKDKGYNPTPAPTNAVTHKVVVGKTIAAATLKHECDCSPQYEASEFLRCVIDEDGKHVHEVSLPFAAHLMAKNAGEYSDDHICSVVGDACRCCVCDDKNEPPSIDSLGTGWYWIAPPFVTGDHIESYASAKSLQECEQKCSDAPSCVTGTYVTTFEGVGQCWLATKALKHAERCVEQCESFVKRTKGADHKEAALAKWYHAFHQKGGS